MECTPTNCSKCELSEWTEWSNCTDECGGISKRFRSYYGINCERNDTIEETRNCDECNCTFNDLIYAVLFFFCLKRIILIHFLF